MPRRSRSYGSRYGWAPYVRVARRHAAGRHGVTALLRERGVQPSPVEARGGRKISRTFWGTAWCDNLERYSDYKNRLPRGRTYVRNGSVMHLEVSPGAVFACVAGRAVYEVKIGVQRVSEERWRRIVEACGSSIDSVVELLAGNVDAGVMQVITSADGLFPAPTELDLSCSCPDWAVMCKHVAATLYGVGARLDDEPRLLFELRGVDELDLVATAADAGGLGVAPSSRALDDDDLGELFGIDVDAPEVAPAPREPAPVPREPAPAGAEVEPRVDWSAVERALADAIREGITRGVEEGLERARAQPRGADAGWKAVERSLADALVAGLVGRGST